VTSFRRVPDRARDRGDAGSEQPGRSRYRFVARFTATDAMLLRDLVGQVAELVGGPAAPRPVDAPGPDAPGRDALGPDAPGRDALGPDALGPDALGPDALGLEALGLTQDASLPDDPALARLLPDAYRDDPEAASEFRRYTEKDLRAGKVAAANTVLETLPAGGGRISLSEVQAQVWLRALNDIRLALGVRLGITEDVGEEMSRIRPDNPRYGVLAVYDWLSVMQESLVHALW